MLPFYLLEGRMLKPQIFRCQTLCVFLKVMPATNYESRILPHPNMCIPYWPKECQEGSPRECQIPPKGQGVWSQIHQVWALDVCGWAQDITRFGWELSRFGLRSPETGRNLTRFGLRSGKNWKRSHEIWTECSRDFFFFFFLCQIPFGDPYGWPYGLSTNHSER